MRQFQGPGRWKSMLVFEGGVIVKSTCEFNDRTEIYNQITPHL